MNKITFSLMAVLLSFNLFCGASTNVDTNIFVGGVKHKLGICLPAGYNPSNSYPLVIGLHYCGSSSNAERNALKPLVDSLDVILVCPDNNTNEMTNPDFILASIDTATNMYNIDTTMIYLTGMSCNGNQTLLKGLAPVYPFRGIFPWVPYFSTFTSSTYNLDSEVPVVISVGSEDSNYGAILRLYDSLEAHGSDVDLVIVQGIGHVLDFGSFSNEMIRCMHYLNDTNAISIDTLPTFTMFNTDLPADIKVKIAHEAGKEINIRALSSNTLLASNPAITKTDGNDTIVLKITPNGARRYGIFKIIVEVSEIGGTAIEQRVFKVDLQNGPISAVEVNSDELVAIYPNPAENQVYINSLERNISIRIFDINGRTVYSADNIDNSLPVDINGLTKGIYFLNARGNNLNKTIRLIKD